MSQPIILAIPIRSSSVYCVMSPFFKVSRIAIPYHTLMKREMTNQLIIYLVIIYSYI